MKLQVAKGKTSLGIAKVRLGLEMSQILTNKLD